MADTGTISHASISENVHSVLIYMCTNFGAFVKKWTIGLICLTMPLHYMTLCKKLQKFVRLSFTYSLIECPDTYEDFTLWKFGAVQHLCTLLSIICPNFQWID